MNAGFSLPFPFNWLLEPHTTLVSGFGVGLLGLGGGFGVRFWFGNGLSGFGDGFVGGWLLWRNVVMGCWLHSGGKGLYLVVLGVLGFGFGWFRFWAMVLVLLDICG